MEYTMQDVIQIIGHKEVAIAVLSAQVTQLMAENQALKAEVARLTTMAKESA